MSNLLLPAAIAAAVWVFFLYARRWRGPWRETLFVVLALYFLWIGYSHPSHRYFSLWMVVMAAAGLWNYRRLRRASEQRL